MDLHVFPIPTPPLPSPPDPSGFLGQIIVGFPGGSAGEASICNVGDLGSIPGLQRSMEKGTATHSSILAWRSPWGHKDSDRTEWLSVSLFISNHSMPPHETLQRLPMWSRVSQTLVTFRLPMIFPLYFCNLIFVIFFSLIITSLQFLPLNRVLIWHLCINFFYLKYPPYPFSSFYS